MKTFAAVTIGLAAITLCATNAGIINPGDLILFPDSHEQSIILVERKPSPDDLPNDCAIIATEAAARLASTGAWTRVLFCRFFDPRTGKVFAHALCVWQPPTARTICIYDRSGTFDLDTIKHDSYSVSRAYAKCLGVIMLEAHYLS